MQKYHDEPKQYKGYLKSALERYDGNGDGTSSQGELGASLIYNSTADNPHGAINYDRLVQTAAGTSGDRLSRAERLPGGTFNATDCLSVNLGVRTERFAHIATDGTNIFTFGWTLAPRSA